MLNRNGLQLLAWSPGSRDLKQGEETLNRHWMMINFSKAKKNQLLAFRKRFLSTVKQTGVLRQMPPRCN